MQVQDVRVEAADIIEAMRTDADYFAGVVTPEVHTERWSTMHLSIWYMLLAALQSGLRITRHAIGIPRGHAKTQLLKLLIVYIILFTNLKYIMVVCNTTPLARSFIDDVMAMLRSDNIKKLFGDVDAEMEKDNAEYRKFKFRGRTVILKPMGAGNSVRGTNIDNTRPEVIINDDMQSADEAKSIEISKQLQSWFMGTLLKARSYRRAHIVYVGNMYPDLEITSKGALKKIYTCILRNLDLNKNWISWVTGAIQADGTAIWPAVQPVESLLEDLEEDTSQGQRATWFAEVQNDPAASAGEWFDITKMHIFQKLPGQEPIARFYMIDPSLGKKKSDGQQVALCAVYNENGIVIESIEPYQMEAPQLVETLVPNAIKNHVPLISAEAYGYQESLLQWFSWFMVREQVDSILLAAISRPSAKGGLTKNLAIHASFKLVYSGYIQFSPEAAAVYGSQATDFNLLSTENTDDILDVVEYCPRVWQKYRDACIIDQVLTTAYSDLEDSYSRDDSDSYHPATTTFYHG